MANWYKATEIKEVPPGTMKGVEVAGTKRLLGHGPDGIRAFED